MALTFLWAVLSVVQRTFMAMPWLLKQGDLDLNPGFPSYHPVYLCRYFNLSMYCPKCRTAYPLLGGLARDALVFDTVHCNSVLFQMFITLCSSIIHVTQINYYVPHMVLTKFRNYYTSLANNKHSDGSCYYSPVVQGRWKIEEAVGFGYGLDRESEVFFSKSN